MIERTVYYSERNLFFEFQGSFLVLANLPDIVCPLASWRVAEFMRVVLAQPVSWPCSTRTSFETSSVTQRRFPALLFSQLVSWQVDSGTRRYRFGMCKLTSLSGSATVRQSTAVSRSAQIMSPLWLFIKDFRS